MYIYIFTYIYIFKCSWKTWSSGRYIYICIYVFLYINIYMMYMYICKYVYIYLNVGRRHETVAGQQAHELRWIPQRIARVCGYQTQRTRRSLWYGCQHFLVAVCCNLLQCVAVYHSVLQGVAVCCSVLWTSHKCNTGRLMTWVPTSPSCSVLLCVTVYCSLLGCCSELWTSNTWNAAHFMTQRTTFSSCSVLQCVAIWCSVMQCLILCCSVLQYATVCCSVSPYVVVIEHEKHGAFMTRMPFSPHFAVSYISTPCLLPLHQCHMGWLRLVGSLKFQISFAKGTYKRDDILQKKPIILRSLLIVATPEHLRTHTHTYVHIYFYIYTRIHLFAHMYTKMLWQVMKMPKKYTCVYEDATTLCIWSVI